MGVRALSVLLLVLLGCGHQPTITYPKLPAVGAEEAVLDCAGVAAAILRTDTIRWVMREDGAYLLTSGEIAGHVVGSIAMEAVLWGTLIPNVTPPLNYSGHFELAAADRRLRDLLALKRDKACAPVATGRHGMNDMQLLDALDKLMGGEIDARHSSLSERERVEERTRLLDDLRQWPPPV